jgi:cellulose synthase/poly-beta-1,6-N-acetylglucosamine synthase-like glycosyltransferase
MVCITMWSPTTLLAWFFQAMALLGTSAFDMLKSLVTIDPLTVLSTLTASKVNMFFVFIFVIRYLRLVVHMISYYFIYRPTPIPANPTLKPSDVTVIVPTIDPENDGFQECLRTVLQNQPGAILIVTVGNAKVKLVNKVIKPFRKSWPSTTISVTQTNQANKRRQVCHAIPQVRTAITVLLDDHVYWPSLNFLPTILAPFEDPQVGGLGTHKVVRRTGSGYGINSVFNFLGCVYLERHNFEITATNAIDGGVFVLSGRTAAYRTCILNDQTFLNGFANEMFFFGKLGPINPDDDNFITRYIVKNGWKIKIQNCPDATIETDLGNPGKYLSQCLRWVRTTWRSNSCSLFTDRTVWRAQPWCVYAVYWTSFFNFALFYDAAMLISLWNTTFGSVGAVQMLACWIFASKMVKLLPHFRRNPTDLLLIPAYLMFAYYHSLMKLWALFTFYDCHWGGRNLAAVDASANNDDNDDDDSSDDDDDDDQSKKSHGGFSTGTSYHSAGSHFPSGGSSDGKQTVFNRFFESDNHGPNDTALPPASTTGSSGQSASYGISKWAAWEKAGHSHSQYRSAPNAQPMPVARSTTASSTTDRSSCARQIQAENVLKPHDGSVSTTSRYGRANDPRRLPAHMYRSPIWTRFSPAGSSDASSVVSGTKANEGSTFNLGSLRTGLEINNYLLSTTTYPASSSKSSRTVSAKSATSSSTYPDPCFEQLHGETAYELRECCRAGPVEIINPKAVRPEYRRAWERGSDCKRQHDEGMGLNWGQCAFGDVRELGL